MKRLALVAAALALGLVLLVAAGCGGVPQGAIATVDGVSITQAQFNQYISQAKASASQDGESAFPKPGTSAYRQLSAQAVDDLVDQQIVLNAAPSLKITVTSQQVQTQLQQLAAEYGGTQKLYAAAQQAGIGSGQLTTYIKDSMISQAVSQKVVGNPTPTEKQIEAYYRTNRSQYVKRATRTVRHVLVKTETEALKVRALLLANNTDANWAKVAKTYSIDAGTKNKGGSLGAITRGQMNKAFSNAAFSLRIDTISTPVHSTDGWHVIEVTKITPARTTTFAKAKSTIKSTLTSQMQQTAWSTWLNKELKAAKIAYGAGYNPAQLSPVPSASPSPSPSASK